MSVPDIHTNISLEFRVHRVCNKPHTFCQDSIRRTPRIYHADNPHMHLHAPPQIRILREIHIGLDDRHQARLLADRRKARQALRLRLEARLRRQHRRAAHYRRTPLRETRPVCAGVAQPREEVVEPLRRGLVRRDGERVRVGVGAHAWDDPACAEEGSELEVDERFGVQDDARDVLCLCGQRGLSIV